MALVSCLLLQSCSGDGSQTLEGSYTYKTSGTVTLMATQLAGLPDAQLEYLKSQGINVDPVVVGLYPEQGQMHILTEGMPKGQAKITFNDLLGNAVITEATIDGDSMTLKDGATKSAQLTDGNSKIGAGIVAYTGSGRKYDDMLLIDLEYQGVFTVNETQMTVVASDVHCVAQAND